MDKLLVSRETSRITLIKFREDGVCSVWKIICLQRIVQLTYKSKHCSMVQKQILHVMAVKKMITLLKMEFDWLLKVILLTCLLMTFFMTPTTIRNLNSGRIKSIYHFQNIQTASVAQLASC
jgi:hypothetical protein